MSRNFFVSKKSDECKIAELKQFFSYIQPSLTIFIIDKKLYQVLLSMQYGTRQTEKMPILQKMPRFYDWKGNFFKNIHSFTFKRWTRYQTSSWRSRSRKEINTVLQLVKATNINFNSNFFNPMFIIFRETVLISLYHIFAALYREAILFCIPQIVVLLTTRY